MNPEFRRNFWLELTPRRAVFMIVVLGLVFFAAAISGGTDFKPSSAATFLFYFIVVFWGSRNAALSVVGEIRDRTWDSQRLSSLSAGTMTWGKLFGSTVYNWFGGFICLAVMLSAELVHKGPVTTLISFVYFISIGVISQAAALLASLIAVRRRQAQSRLGAFIYQIAGVIAGIWVYAIWSAADPAGSIFAGKRATDFIVWWGHSFDARPFLLISLAVFAAWTLIACYRTMRIELKMHNGPFVWLGFLLFMGLYAAGFDAWLSSGPEIAGWGVIALRLALAMSTFGILTYVMVLLEPKDRVHFRWLGEQLVSGHPVRAVLGLQAWMLSYLATIASAAVLVFWLLQVPSHSFAPRLAMVLDHTSIAVIISAAGFLTRDVALFVLFQSLPGRRRGDFAAIVSLIALHGLIPVILNGLDLHDAMVLFRPAPVEPLWLGPVVAWGEGIVVAALAIMRISAGEKIAAEPARA
jgi:hypothetical protein